MYEMCLSDQSYKVVEGLYSKPYNTLNILTDKRIIHLNNNVEMYAGFSSRVGIYKYTEFREQNF